MLYHVQMYHFEYLLFWVGGLTIRGEVDKFWHRTENLSFFSVVITQYPSEMYSARGNVVFILTDV